jgi:intracellular multiplication protein IcmK
MCKSTLARPFVGVSIPRMRGVQAPRVSPDDLRAWKVGNRVVLRTRFALISPEWLASQTGEGGVTIYSLPITPVVLLSQDGVTVSASFSEP